MSDIKTERLINLTMALLATKRPLTKEEILASVAGYSGTQEAMERMFERDKDDLRILGIEIEVLPIDPYFDDELGYRVTPEKYSLEIPDFTPAELALLSLAAKSWSGQLFSHQGQRALRKLESLGVELDEAALESSVLTMENPVEGLELLWEALLQKRTVSFAYAVGEQKGRNLQPYGLTLHEGDWYMAGFDLDRKAMRTFKVRRMSSLQITSKGGSYEIPSDFSIGKIFKVTEADQAIKMKFKVRQGKGFAIRRSAHLIEKDGEWDLMEKSYVNPAQAVKEILWHGSDVRCLAPQEIVDEVVRTLQIHARTGVSDG